MNSQSFFFCGSHASIAVASVTFVESATIIYLPRPLPLPHAPSLPPFATTTSTTTTTTAAASFHVSHRVCNMPYRDPLTLVFLGCFFLLIRYTLPFEVAVAPLPTNTDTPVWFSAATLYREWALSSAAWTRKGPISERPTDFPKWFLDLNVWVNTGWQVRVTCVAIDIVCLACTPLMSLDSEVRSAVSPRESAQDVFCLCLHVGEFAHVSVV